MKRHIYLLIFTIMFSCDKAQEPDYSFEIDAWKSDKLACNGFRQSTLDEFIQRKDIYLKWPERQITEYLGRPDMHRLSKRHQKFYVYFLEPSEECKNNKGGTKPPLFLQLRFDATGYVSEIELRDQLGTLD